MSLATTLFPAANRQAALTAFLRTAWQTARASIALFVTGGVVVTAGSLLTVDWFLVLLTVAAVVIMSVLAGALSAGDILIHGLPDAYTAPVDAGTASSSAPAVITSLPVENPVGQSLVASPPADLTPTDTVSAVTVPEVAPAPPVVEPVAAPEPELAPVVQESPADPSAPLTAIVTSDPVPAVPADPANVQ
ncbi:hypothetical protein [Subtercola endophyticus]|uniref:hypothetical protein n=1 Tax=Subtercola endophyticus TaxID=2895559 RepID=UPI001E3E61F4|nr:hypothetical protein [Subtercola endophyticus]UFS59462.1 hypothetical protein LQ955_01285 [Subtercola endophyticus]